MTTPTVLLGVVAIGMLAIEWFRLDVRHRTARVLGALAAVLALGELTREPEPVWPAPARPVVPGGLVPELDAPLEVETGAPLELRGRLALDRADSAWVMLADPVGPRDSVLIHGAQPFFALRDRPRAAGTPIYTLRVRGGWKEAAETIGVAVRVPRSPAVLVLDGSPSFETSYLKRWLARGAARVTVRTTISRDRYQVQTLNGPATRAEPVTGALLGCYDVVVADQEGLAALSESERRSLSEAIHGGLGLLVSAGQSQDHASLADFPMGPSDDDHSALRISWPGAPPSRIGVETSERHFLKQADAEGLAWDDRGRIIAIRRRDGAGWVGSTLVRTPSRWQIEGEAERFGGYWSLLLGALARDTTVRASLAGDARRYADEPVELSLWSGGTPPVMAMLAPDGTPDTLPLARDPFNPSRWSSRYWPRTAGWRALRLPDREVPFLVRPPRPAPAPLLPEREAGWRRGFAFLVLVMALTGLWVEARRRGR